MVALASPYPLDLRRLPSATLASARDCPSPLCETSNWLSGSISALFKSWRRASLSWSLGGSRCKPRQQRCCTHDSLQNQITHQSCPTTFRGEQKDSGNLQSRAATPHSSPTVPANQTNALLSVVLGSAANFVKQQHLTRASSSRCSLLHAASITSALPHMHLGCCIQWRAMCSTELLRALTTGKPTTTLRQLVDKAEKARTCCKSPVRPSSSARLSFPRLRKVIVTQAQLDRHAISASPHTLESVWSLSPCPLKSSQFSRRLLFDCEK